MPVAGSHKKGFWMEIVDGKLTIANRETYSAMCEQDVHAAAKRLLAGERVHVYSVYPTPTQVATKVQVALGSGA